jgi:hypothetical protein
MAAYVFDEKTGTVLVTHPTKEEAAARARAYIWRAPWLADMPDAIEAGLSFATVPQGRYGIPLLRRDYRTALLLTIGDDMGLAAGPDGFHRASIRKALTAAVFVGIVPGAPHRAFYGRAIRAALEARRIAVLIETQRYQLPAWAKLAARYAKVPVEIDDEASGTA